MARKAKQRARGGVPGKHASPGSGSVYMIRSGARTGAYRGAALVTLPDGTRRRIYVVGADEADARAQLEQKAARAEGRILPPDDSGITVSTWLLRWLQTTVKLQRRAGTFDAYIVRAKHIERYLGTTPLRDLTGPAVQWMLGQLTSEPQGRGNRRAQPLSAATAGHVLATLKAAVRAAVDAGVIAADPIARLKPPRTDRVQHRVMADDQLLRVLTSAQEMAHPLALAFMLYGTTALRRGEVVGLHWGDINMEAATITVVRQRTRNRTQGVHQADPKTAAGVRTVSFPAELVPDLQAHQAAQRESRLRSRPPWPDAGPFVFLTAAGEPYAPETVGSAWRYLLRKLGVPHLHLHGLRHSVATSMMRDGESPKMVSELLGHANVTLTLSTYSHVMPGMQAGAIGRRGAAILPHKNDVAAPVAVHEAENRA